MSNDIKAGDLVVLKSGSLTMTVVWVEDGTAYCEWFDTKHEPQGRQYAVITLKHA